MAVVAWPCPRGDLNDRVLRHPDRASRDEPGRRRQEFCPFPILAHNGMILLLIFAYGGGARPGMRTISSVTFEKAKPSCRPDHDDAAMGIFRATLLAQAAPAWIAERSFHFLICHLAHIRVMCDGF
jgi:hypothetical protein